MEMLFILIEVVLKIVLLLVSVAFLSLFERKLLGYSQSRKGPNVVWKFGVFQPFADAMKLISKVDSSPGKASMIGFFVSPVFFFFVMLGSWSVIPVEFNSSSFQFSGMFIIFWLSLGTYSLIFSGWFSFSKFSTLGICRAIAQSISYEIVFTFSIFSIFLVAGSVNLLEIVYLFEKNSPVLITGLLSVIFFISILAESNRTPFDLPEGESELVGGYSVEYGSISYTILFLGENVSLIFSSFFFSLIFFSGFLFLMKFSFFLFLFIWIRSTLPRIRFDKMMNLCWLELIPPLLGMIGFISVLL
uniref:NADH-ubiquinone oxidoreductase chain 1 n=1 Tax=Columbicola passerinae TaxID=128994 RepID=A0A6G8QRW1_9NEOP|nr:NADH dehydrogenase subunit 1 [Columbicola passerinae]